MSKLNSKKIPTGANPKNNEHYITSIVPEEELVDRFKFFQLDCPADMYQLLDRSLQSFLIVYAQEYGIENSCKKRKELETLRDIFKPTEKRE